MQYSFRVHRAQSSVDLAIFYWSQWGLWRAQIVKVATSLLTTAKERHFSPIKKLACDSRKSCAYIFCTYLYGLLHRIPKFDRDCVISCVWKKKHALAQVNARNMSAGNICVQYSNNILALITGDCGKGVDARGRKEVGNNYPHQTWRTSNDVKREARRSGSWREVRGGNGNKNDSTRSDRRLAELLTRVPANIYDRVDEASLSQDPCRFENKRSPIPRVAIGDAGRKRSMRSTKERGPFTKIPIVTTESNSTTVGITTSTTNLRPQPRARARALLLPASAVRTTYARIDDPTLKLLEISHTSVTRTCWRELRVTIRILMTLSIHRLLQNT